MLMDQGYRRVRPLEGGLEAWIEAGGQVVGEVTSGSFAPFLKRPLGMGYVPSALAAVGTPIRIDIRGKPAAAVVVKLPFYRRKKT